MARVETPDAPGTTPVLSGKVSNRSQFYDEQTTACVEDMGIRKQNAVKNRSA
jgi:hypothetical protein